MTSICAGPQASPATSVTAPVREKLSCFFLSWCSSWAFIWITYIQQEQIDGGGGVINAHPTKATRSLRLGISFFVCSMMAKSFFFA